ncbi:unnamed protein product, partial [Chrysoparadoxa australica]
DDPLALAVRCQGRDRLFFCQEREALLQQAMNFSQAIGALLHLVAAVPLQAIQEGREKYHNGHGLPPPISSYTADKLTVRMSNADNSGNIGCSKRLLEISDQ